MAAAEPLHLAPGEGPSIENPTGGRLTFKAMADETGGALTVVEATAAPAEGAPLHVHRGQDETIYVLNVRYRMRLGERELDAPAGAFVSSRAARHTHGRTLVPRSSASWPRSRPPTRRRV
jgi:quercetin dioxygenase-like cupin family protein